METAYTQLCRTWQRLAPRLEANFSEEPFIEPSPEQFDYLPPEAAAALKAWYKSLVGKVVKNCAALRVPYKNWLITLKTDGDFPVVGTTYRVAVRADYVPLSSFRLLMVHGPISQMNDQLQLMHNQLLSSPLGGWISKAGGMFKNDTASGGTARDSDPSFRSGNIDIDSVFSLFGNDIAQANRFLTNWRVREGCLGISEPQVMSFGLYGYVVKQINIYQSISSVDQEDTEKTVNFLKLSLDTLAAQGLIATEPSSTESNRSA